MAVIINNMDMPKCCADCEFELMDEYELLHECVLLYKGYTNHVRTFDRMQNCPLREVAKDG